MIAGFTGTFLLLFGLIRDASGIQGWDYSLPQDTLKGRTVFESKGCVECHAVLGVGGALGPDLSKIGLDRSFLQVAGLLWSHSPKMIEMMEERGIQRPGFTPDEMAELVTYLFSLRYLDEPGDYDRGESVFSGKQCVRCHSLGGTGGKIASPLDKYGSLGTPAYLGASLWNHGVQMTEELEKGGVAFPKLEGRDMADLLAYISGASVGQKEIKKYLFPGRPDDGEQVFQQKDCIRCHSVKGKGGSAGPDLGRGLAHKGITEVVGSMWNHSPQMRKEAKEAGIGFKPLNEQEIADVIAYLYYISCLDENGDPQKGRELFSRKSCSQCHPNGKDGKTAGPKLNARSPVKFAADMWNHAPIMEKVLKEMLLPWPRFENDELPDLVAYIQTTSASTQTTGEQ
jgi:nitric oxide reductase subunit C